eukprot:4262139-Amphidinium_carterae.1
MVTWSFAIDARKVTVVAVIEEDGQTGTLVPAISFLPAPQQAPLKLNSFPLKAEGQWRHEDSRRNTMDKKKKKKNEEKSGRIQNSLFFDAKRRVLVSHGVIRNQNSFRQ